MNKMFQSIVKEILAEYPHLNGYATTTCPTVVLGYAKAWTTKAELVALLEQDYDNDNS